jgi:hypothetical protein
LKRAKAYSAARKTTLSAAGSCKVVILLLLLSLISAGAASAREKTVIGAVEEIKLLQWGITIPARVDTGAAISSLDVCEYEVQDNHVSFTLPDRCGGHKTRLPLVDMRNIQTGGGGEQRPVVVLEICIGTRKARPLVTLNDRSRLEFPFLIGRNVLEGNFVVDVSRIKTATPNCPDAKLPRAP